MPTLRSLYLTLTALALIATPSFAQSSGFGNDVVLGENEMLVGEPNSAFRPGLVYVYRKTGDTWTETATLEAPDAERQDGFGALLALNGSTLFVAQRGGRIHTFEKQGDAWRFTGTPVDGVVEGLDPGCNAYGYCGNDFGLALAAEGDWLLVGEPGARALPQRGRRGRGGRGGGADGPTGAVYAFQRGANGQWTQAQVIESPETAPGDGFGTAIAFAGDRLLIGAPHAPRGGDAGSEPVEGAGRVFEFELLNGQWRSAGEITVSPESTGGFGTAITVAGDRAVIGSPGAAEGAGVAYVFGRSGQGWTQQSRLAYADGEDGDRFGAAIAIDGDDIWVGAPVQRGIETGMAFRFSGDGAPERIRFTEEETNTEDAFGARIVTRDGVAALVAIGMDHGAGGVFVYERDGSGAWRQEDLLVSPPDALPAVTGEERRCGEEGSIELFDCNDIDLLAYVPISILKAPGDNRGVRMNDNWGWTDPETGREYAIAGRNDGASFVDITDPANPVLVADLPKTPGTPRSHLWRDIKTYRNHAYVVADGAGEHGMQVLDLTRLRGITNPPVVIQPDVLYRGTEDSPVEDIHNVIINEETGFAYLTGGGCPGLHMVDIREPKNPTFAGCTGEAPAHDAHCVIYRGPDEDYQGREVCFAMSGSRFQISDVTEKDNWVELAMASHPNPAYMHQGWTTEDHAYFIMDDESDVIAGNVDKTRTLIWDISDLEDPQLAKEFMGSMEASAHNLYVKGDFTYQANYRYGLHILDTSDPLNPREVGYFDTSPYQTGPGFSGAWSVYPFFESGSIIITSMQEGLFVLKKRDRPIS